MAVQAERSNAGRFVGSTNVVLVLALRAIGLGLMVAVTGCGGSGSSSSSGAFPTQSAARATEQAPETEAPSLTINSTCREWISASSAEQKAFISEVIIPEVRFEKNDIWSSVVYTCETTAVTRQFGIRSERRSSRTSALFLVSGSNSVALLFEPGQV
jgi:hypothetical protein